MWPQPHIRILLTKYAAFRWVARSLEHDIVVEGRAADEAIQALRAIICAHVSFDRRHQAPVLGAFPPAPARVWDAFERATPIGQSPEPSDDEVAFAIAIADAGPSWGPLDPTGPGAGAVTVQPDAGRA
jgi:hypothetical protein